MFVWNRSAQVFESEEASFLPEGVVLHDLADFASRGADLIVEVAHPDITKLWGEKFLRSANYLVCGLPDAVGEPCGQMGSPTAMADKETEAMVRAVAGEANGHGVYVPAGALWGGEDIAKMADAGDSSA